MATSFITFDNAIKQIGTNKIKNGYVLCCNDYFSLKNFLDSITAKISMPELNIEKIDYEKIENPLDIVEKLEQYPFMSEKRIVIVEKMDLKDKKNLIKTLSKYSIPEYSILIISTFIQDKRENLSKNTKLTKALKNGYEVVYTKNYTDRYLKEFINQIAQKNQLFFETKAIDLMIRNCNDNLDILYNEVLKLGSYSSNITEPITKNLSCIVDNFDAFDLTDALSLRNISKCMDIVNSLSEKGENAVSIFYLIYRQVKLLYYAKMLNNSNNLIEMFKLHPYVAKLTIEKSNNFSIEQLRNDYLLCGSMEKEMKNTGDGQFKLEKLIYKLVE